MSDQEILYAADVARMVGKTQQAFTAAMQRNSNAVPPGRFKMGRLWAWKRSTVEEWLRALYRAGYRKTAAEDLSDPANWREGDYLTCISDALSFVNKGSVYQFVGRRGRYEVAVMDNDGDTVTYDSEDFRFHHRP